jgi:hypothetical protein
LLVDDGGYSHFGHKMVAFRARLVFFMWFGHGNGGFRARFAAWIPEQV